MNIIEKKTLKIKMASNRPDEEEESDNFFLQSAREPLIKRLRLEYQNSAESDPNSANFDHIRENYPDLWEEITQGIQRPPSHPTIQQQQQQQNAAANQPQQQQPADHQSRSKSHLIDLQSPQDYLRIHLAPYQTEVILREIGRRAPNVAQFLERTFSTEWNNVKYLSITLFMGLMSDLIGYIFDDVHENESEEGKEIQIDINHPNMSTPVTSGKKKIK